MNGFGSVRAYRTGRSGAAIDAVEVSHALPPNPLFMLRDIHNLSALLRLFNIPLQTVFCQVFPDQFSMEGLLLMKTEGCILVLDWETFRTISAYHRSSRISSKLPRTACK
jgi:hypothetical protein